MKTSRLIAAAAALLAGVLVLGAVYVTVQREQSSQSSVMSIGGPFVLASTKGGEVDSRTLEGQPYAMFFGFTHCPEVCPTTLYEMSNSLAKLGSKAKNFRVFFVTVDPERDTLPVLKDYLANFDPRIEALVPDQAQLQKLAKDFRVYYAKVPSSDGSYSMDHTASIFLFDASGRFSGTLSYDEASTMRDAKLERLMGG
ncbi:SCO family protein [Aestuariivirga sp.]|uniref:SCO family protein n=1 Tax=Aestuariivirga sp. TaxID=2650926 RepID=UPI003BAB7B97